MRLTFIGFDLVNDVYDREDTKKLFIEVDQIVSLEECDDSRTLVHCTDSKRYMVAHSMPEVISLLEKI